MPRYYLKVWEWDVNRQEYLPYYLHECDDYKTIKRIFDSITVNADRMQVALYEIREDNDELLAFKDTWEGETE